MSCCARVSSQSSVRIARGWGRLPLAALLAALALPAAARALGEDTHPDPGMLRYPDISATQIVFVYADDLWLVPREGGVALPLASPPGPEGFPRFSPDGKTIAFIGHYDGNTDLYTLPVEGGVAQRVTHHPQTELLSDWTPDGKLLFASTHEAPLGGRQQQLFVVGPHGGLPERLAVPYGGDGAISADGEWLAYVPIPFDFRTWKRYQGGTAMDIWLFDLKTHVSRRMTTFEGTDSQPMWHGNTVYYLSDANPNHKLNLWSFDTIGGVRQQVTDLDTWDCKWPAIGPGPDGGGEIVFQHGPALQVLDLKTRTLRKVEVTIPGDRATIRPRTVDVSGQLGGWEVSPTGKRVAVEARGDLWTLPAEQGGARRLTSTDNATERWPAWSPDGQWIAYFSDASGEYELHLMQSDGKGEAQQLTNGNRTYFFMPHWSPDSKRLAYLDRSGQLWVHDIAAKTSKIVDRDPYAGAPATSWSNDGRWLAYTKSGTNMQTALWLHDTSDGSNRQLTSGRFRDTQPCFDRDGKYLYFASNRDFSEPLYEDLGTSFVYSNTDRLLLVPLRADVPSPWLPKNDEELWGDAKKKAEEEAAGKGKEGGKDGAEKKPDAAADAGKADEGKSADAGKEKDKEPLRIDVDGFEQRAVLLPVERGNFVGLSVASDGRLVYGRAPGQGMDDKTSVRAFDVTDVKKEEKTLADKADGFALTADGKKLLVVLDGAATMRDANPAAEAKPVSKDGLRATVSPREEWHEIFTDAWRRYRDFFYDPNMHGVDWDGMRTRYSAMLDDCYSRADLAYVIRELISELNVGHAYYNPGPEENVPTAPVGLLGADFRLEQGAYRLSRIYGGAPWDVDARGPLSEPGANVKEGDFLLAVNGVALDTAQDPWAAFTDLADKTVTLTVSAKPVRDADARDVLVKPVADDGQLRYRWWVEQNRRAVDEKTGGKVGYIHVPDTGVIGQNNLFRQFYGQIDKAALIIDERWNGGGQIPTRFIELLNRPATNLWTQRDSLPIAWPPDSHQGPKCMLINLRAGSGGDAFPYYFREAKIGKLIGTRTWGGLVGIGDLPAMLDGASVSVPSFAFYENDGTWGVEGHGVDPDIEVVDDPALMVDGGDPQLDKAIEVMLDELRSHPYVMPPVPPYPNRSGMGIPAQDR